MSFQAEVDCTALKMKFDIKDFFSKCDQIRSKLRISSYLLKKTVMENFIFCAVLITLNKFEFVIIYISMKSREVKSKDPLSLFSRINFFDCIYHRLIVWNCPSLKFLFKHSLISFKAIFAVLKNTTISIRCITVL